MKNQTDLFSGLSPSTTRQPAAVPINLDTRLIAAVQTRAGARCHQAASLLHGYYMCAEVYRAKQRRGDRELVQAALGRLQECERRLRDFLTACPQPAAAWTPGRPSPAYAYAG